VVVLTAALLSAVGAAAGASAAVRYNVGLASCTNPEGGACVGKLKAGKVYKTIVFHPSITYVTPAGWSNFEDTPGNFLLVPPGNTLPGVNAGTSDYIGVYASIAAPRMGCASGPAPGVKETPAGIAGWIEKNPGLTSTAAKAVTVGGLHGLVLDTREVKGWKKPCFYSNGTPVVQLITGLPPSGLDHNLIPRLVIRLFLLRSGANTLAIEVDGLHNGRNLAAYTRVVKHMKFGR
jgi:hypothetical protein